MTFIQINDKLVNAYTINSITVDQLVMYGFIHIHYYDGEIESVSGPEAVDVVMRLCPSAVEGRRFKFLKFHWAIHNLIGHPLMQVLSWLGLRSWGLKVHDATVPNPKVSNG